MHTSRNVMTMRNSKQASMAGMVWAQARKARDRPGGRTQKHGQEP
jgi:hypothetical protein